MPDRRTCLQVPLFYAFDGSPICMEGLVIEGAGRGSKEMGFPTANLNAEPFQQVLAEMSIGVYFGCVLCSTNSLYSI